MQNLCIVSLLEEILLFLEVEIAQWLVNDGDFVEKDQTIAEVDSSNS